MKQRDFAIPWGTSKSRVVICSEDNLRKRLRTRKRRKEKNGRLGK